MTDYNGIVTQSQLSAKWLDIDVLYKEVHFQYLPKVNDKAVEDAEEHIKAERPNVVILDLFSNDLAEVDSDRTVIDVATGVYNFASRIKRKYGVQVVSILKCLRRTGEINCSPEAFEARMLECHKNIQVPINYTFNIDLMRLHGFERYRNGGKMAVAYYSDTGITPGPASTSYGFRKYRRNVRQVLQAAVPKWISGY